MFSHGPLIIAQVAFWDGHVLNTEVEVLGAFMSLTKASDLCSRILH